MYMFFFVISNSLLPIFSVSSAFKCKDIGKTSFKQDFHQFHVIFFMRIKVQWICIVVFVEGFFYWIHEYFFCWIHKKYTCIYVTQPLCVNISTRDKQMLMISSQHLYLHRVEKKQTCLCIY